MGEKAFLMIGMAPEDRKFLKFLWNRGSDHENYRIMQMTRLPFGCKISPFILSTVIKHHMAKFKAERPDSVSMLNSGLYVDDLYFGADSVMEAFQLSWDAVTILRSGGFKLRKLRSSNSDLRALSVKTDFVRIKKKNALS
ncbi:Gag-Pol polyprotein-like protein [Argiope bruennichi]|uniref:Gag-Pol polyprotein-like protein n=1 Tax=Argiope bruennichi TaxID=94029 RepID=A0A8T0F3F0_ARGBR|nr:Gag-Pol polyprotein-like protein [Argiope bruennichi]